MTNQEINQAIQKATGVIGWATEDLNVMHEAEKRGLGTSRWYEYERNLMRVSTLSYAQGVVCATARHRAEAFLKTLGLWHDKPDAEHKNKVGAVTKTSVG